MRLLEVLIGTLLLGWPVAAGTAAPPAPPLVSVTREGGGDRLSMVADSVPLRTLLGEVAQQTGVEISGNASDRLVSVAFAGLPLERAIQRLLAGESFILVYGESADEAPIRLIRIDLIGQAMEGGMVRPPAVEALPTAEPEGTDAFDPDAPVERLGQWARRGDPATRAEALEALTVHGDDDRARALLLDHVNDPDSHVRSVAVGLLGGLVEDWPGAEDAIAAGTRDPSPAVRRIALGVLGNLRSAKLADAARLAQRDEDEGVRTLAGELAAGGLAEP